VVFAISAVVAVIVALVPAFKAISPFSWFVGAGLGAVLYWAVERRSGGQRRTSEA
jgi:NCS1 family nucleobase:cation symporter-1